MYKYYTHPVEYAYWEDDTMPQNLRWHKGIYVIEEYCNDRNPPMTCAYLFNLGSLHGTRPTNLAPDKYNCASWMLDEDSPLNYDRPFRHVLIRPLSFSDKRRKQIRKLFNIESAINPRGNEND